MTAPALAPAPALVRPRLLVLVLAVLAILPGLGGAARAAGPATAASPGIVVPPSGLPVTAACLLASDGDQVLYADNGDGELPIASTTKLMTALITLQHVDNLSEVFTQTDYYPSPADSQIGLVPGERMSVHDLLLALMLPSADDAAEDLAFNVGGGSVSNFIGMMNAEARVLGLVHTHYATPIGFDTPGNYSSACDLDRLAAYDLATSAYFRRIVALPSATLWSGRYVRQIVNRNDLVGRIPWIHGVKTGHTSGAGYVLVAEGEQNGLELIASVLGTPSEAARDQSALALLDYGYAAYTLATPVTAGTILAEAGERGFPGRRATVVAATSFGAVVHRTDTVRVVVDAPKVLVGPLRRGAVVGDATVLIDGRAAATVRLILARPVPAARPERRRRRRRGHPGQPYTHPGQPYTLPASPSIRPSTLVGPVFVIGPATAQAGILEQRRRRSDLGRLEAG